MLMAALSLLFVVSAAVARYKLVTLVDSRTQPG
jgi:hypothetical protein